MLICNEHVKLECHVLTFLVSNSSVDRRGGGHSFIG